MKLTQLDVQRLRAALHACRIAGINTGVISSGMIRGVGEKQNSAIFSPIQLSLDTSISLGISRLAELEKRLNLFGDEIELDAEVNDGGKVRKLSVRGKGGRMEFRCTDEKLITYPKTNEDEDGIALAFAKPEIALISRAAKALGAGLLTLQVKRDGIVHIECTDNENNDRFETDLEQAAEFLDDPYPVVQSFDTSSNGVFMSMLDYLAKENDTVYVTFKKSGNIGLQLLGFEMIAVPRIQIGD